MNALNICLLLGLCVKIPIFHCSFIKNQEFSTLIALYCNFLLKEQIYYFSVFVALNYARIGKIYFIFVQLLFSIFVRHTQSYIFAIENCCGPVSGAVAKRRMNAET